MISQNCPKCSSSRIRPGYRPTPIWSKLLFRYNLLCDSCNWEFKGFAVPGTVTRKKPKKVGGWNNSAKKSVEIVEKTSIDGADIEPDEQSEHQNKASEDENEVEKHIFAKVKEKKNKKMKTGKLYQKETPKKGKR